MVVSYSSNILLVSYVLANLWFYLSYYHVLRSTRILHSKAFLLKQVELHLSCVN